MPSRSPALRVCLLLYSEWEVNGIKNSILSFHGVLNSFCIDNLILVDGFEGPDGGDAIVPLNLKKKNKFFLQILADFIYNFVELFYFASFKFILPLA